MNERRSAVCVALCFGASVMACSAIAGLGSAPHVVVADGGPGASPDAGGDDAATLDASPQPDAQPIDAGPTSTDEAGDAAAGGDVKDAGAGGACALWSGDGGAAYDANGIEITSACQSGDQNVPAGVTPSASSILVQRGVGGICESGLTLFIADQIPAGSGVYQTLQVPTLAGADTGFEENVTLTPDGLSIVALDSSDKGFVQATRSHAGEVDFDVPVPGDFANIVATGSQTLWAPVLSPDGWAFYYVVKNDPNDDVNGIYESVRSSSSAGTPFPPGTRMLQSVQGFAQYATALSTDRLSIFLEGRSVYAVLMLTRASVNVPFDNTFAPGLPPQVPGIRTRPILGCNEVIGSCTAGGCINEAICIWSL